MEDVSWSKKQESHQMTGKCMYRGRGDSGGGDSHLSVHRRRRRCTSSWVPREALPVLFVFWRTSQMQKWVFSNYMYLIKTQVTRAMSLSRDPVEKSLATQVSSML